MNKRMVFNIVFWAVGGWFTMAAIGGSLIVAGGAYASSQKKAPGAVGYTPVDLQAEQNKSIAGNVANQGAIQSLVSSTNTFDQGQATSLMEQAIPGWGKLQGQLTSTANDLLTNPYALPEDVQQNLERQAAERGVTTGRQGQAGQFSLLRDLGVNELQYGQSRIGQAQGLFSTLAQTAPKANPMSPLSFMTTPGMSAQNQQYTNTAQQGIFQGAANSQTAADNWNNQSLWGGLASSATGLWNNPNFQNAIGTAPKKAQTPNPVTGSTF